MAEAEVTGGAAQAQQSPLADMMANMRADMAATLAQERQRQQGLTHTISGLNFQLNAVRAQLSRNEIEHQVQLA